MLNFFARSATTNEPVAEAMNEHTCDLICFIGMISRCCDIHLIMVYPHLPLQALIATRGVCRKWRNLAEVSHIHPTRRKLLGLYESFVHSPAFLATRPLIEPHLCTFDREAYVSALPASTPDDLRMWLLEWPARAAIACLWPGLDAKFNMSEDIFASRRDARNCLTPTPAVHNLDLALWNGTAHVSALQVFDEGNGWRHWVVLDGKLGDEDLRGCVYSKVRGEDGAAGYGESLEANCWLGYLKAEVSNEQARLEQTGLYCPCQACQDRALDLLAP